MHIILMSEHSGHTYSHRFLRRHAVMLAVLSLAALLATGVLGFSLAPRPTPAQATAAAQTPQLNQLAIEVGEMQARLARLTAIGERVARKAGLPLAELGNRATPGRGGPLETLDNAAPTASDLTRLLDGLGAATANESDRLVILENELRDRQIKQGTASMDRPVLASAFQSSAFGIRPDPFTGRLSHHHGLDFSDTLGAPILAARSGIVLRAERQADYGYLVELDHGNGLISRYGHAGRLLVKPGDVVIHGQKIAEVGSTGRSTGPHLHFEVIKDGLRRDPAEFLDNPV